MLEQERMDEAIRKDPSDADIDEIKAQEYRYWQSRPVYERMAKVSELSSAMYGLKHEGAEIPRLDKMLVRFERFTR
jgi:hypothetical protein